MRRGDQIDREMFKSAIIECSGNVVQMVEHLGLKTDGSVYYLLSKKFPDLKGFWESVKAGNAPSDIDVELDTQVHSLDSKTPPILSRKQVDILNAIDAAQGHPFDVGIVSIYIKNLAERGFITLDNGFATLTETGDVARIEHILLGSMEHQALTSKHTPPTPAKVNRKEFMRPEKGVVAVKPKKEIKAESDCQNCHDCIHHDVLDFIVSNRPEFSELVEQVTKLKLTEREVQAQLKKLGGER